ncbi:MAG: EAL domain-containing protein [Gammaproteobacteria bacterium]|nr:EAL domain-containing protein [Gammaproteobacteria bacterium]
MTNPPIAVAGDAAEQLLLQLAKPAAAALSDATGVILDSNTPFAQQIPWQQETLTLPAAAALNPPLTWQNLQSVLQQPPFNYQQPHHSNRFGDIILKVTPLSSGKLFWHYCAAAASDEIHDPLTGLPTREIFYDRATQAIINADRDKKAVALLRLGLDNFTRLNEGLGHHFGDAILCQFAQRLNKLVRTSDTVARLEGDQFGLVMLISANRDAVLVANKLLQMMESPFRVGEQDVQLAASIGVSIYPEDGKEIEKLLQRARIAMRHVKTDGGSNFRFFASEMNQQARQRIEMENRLRHALEQQEFVLYYQAKVDSSNNKIVGAEALIRWNDPQKGLIPPGQFIPIAEESGLIGRIGLWVLHEACRQNREWLDAGLEIVKISVNVAAPQFRDMQLVEKVSAVLEESAIPPQMLELEITESLLMGDIENTIHKLQQLRDIGLSISIDDFGTGYSSLSYLSRFPITTLKIDRAFIQDVTINHNRAEITRAIIALSQGLNLSIIAEGVENIAHTNFLREHGCNIIQGFYFSRPVAPAEFAKLLQQGTITPE